MKKLQLLFVAAMLLVSVDMRADDGDDIDNIDGVIVNSDLDLYNADVRKCLLDCTKKEGWKLKSVYVNSNKELVMIFDKNNTTKIYKTK